MSTLSWKCEVCGTTAAGPFDETLELIQQHTHTTEEKH